MPLKRLFWVFLLLWVATGIALEVINGHLETAITPFGIISFEFCGFNDSCKAALDQWGQRGQLFAMLSLGIDYLYLLIYPGFFAISILLLQRRIKLNFIPPESLVILACLMMSLTDAIENYGLIQIVLYGPQSSFPMLSGIFASIKFAVFFVVLLWLLYLLVRNFLLRSIRRT